MLPSFASSSGKTSIIMRFKNRWERKHWAGTARVIWQGVHFGWVNESCACEWLWNLLTKQSARRGECIECFFKHVIKLCNWIKVSEEYLSRFRKSSIIALLIHNPVMLDTQHRCQWQSAETQSRFSGDHCKAWGKTSWCHYRYAISHSKRQKEGKRREADF